MASVEDTDGQEKAEKILKEVCAEGGDIKMKTKPQDGEERDHEKDNLINEAAEVDGKEQEVNMTSKEEDVDPADQDEEAEVSDEEEEVDMVGEEEVVDSVDDEEEVDMIEEEAVGMVDEEDDMGSAVLEEDEDKASGEEKEDLTLHDEEEEEVDAVDSEEKLNKSSKEEKMAVDVDVSDISKDSKLGRDAKDAMKQEDLIQSSSDICTEETKIQDKVGTVFRSHRYDPILIYFQHHGKTEIAEASGCLYINGSRSLFTVCQHELMMKSLLNVDDTVHFDAFCQKQKFFLPKPLQKMGRRFYIKTTWIVQLMWKGPKPDVSLLNTEHRFDAQEEYIDALIKQVDLNKKEHDELEEKKKSSKFMTGEISEIISDTHGVMKTEDDNTIIFKKEDFDWDGEEPQEGQTLKDVLHVGESTEAFVKEEELEYETVKYTSQATSIWKSSKHSKVQTVEAGIPECWFMVPVQAMNKRPRRNNTYKKDQVGVIKEVHHPTGGIISLESDKDVWFHRRQLYINNKRFGMSEMLGDAVKIGDTVHCDMISNEGQKHVKVEVAHVALVVWKGEKLNENLSGDVLQGKVLKMDKPRANGVESGLLKIQEKGRYLGKKVAFDRRHVYFYGVPLEKADLAYLMHEGDYVYCTIEAMPENEGGTVTHKATAAWYGNHHGPEVTEELLISHAAGVKHLSNAGIDIDTFEKLVSGKLEPAHEKPLQALPVGYVSAHVVYLDPPQKGKGVVYGYFVLEYGKPGHKVRLSRNSLKVWGVSMKNSDLSYVLNPDDRVICRVWWMRKDKADFYKIKFAWIGNRSASSDDKSMEELEKDSEFTAWLTRHNLDMEKFRLLVDGKLPPMKAADPQPASEGDQKTEMGLYMNPVTMCKVQMHNIVDALLNSSSLDDLPQHHLIQDKDMAQMAEFVSQGLAMLLQNYQEDQARKMERIRSPRRPPIASQYHRGGDSVTGGFSDGSDRARSHDKPIRPRNRDDGDRLRNRTDGYRIRNRESRGRVRTHDSSSRAGYRGVGQARQHGSRGGGGARASYGESGGRSIKSDGSNRPGYRNREDRKRTWRPESRYDDEPYYKWHRMDDTRDSYKSRRDQRQNRSSVSESESADYY